MPPEVCPNCGAEVPPDAKCCPECGADEEMAWSEQAYYDSLDLPDQEFDYDDFVKREFSQSPKPHHVHWVWWGAAILLIVALLLFFVL